MLIQATLIKCSESHTKERRDESRAVLARKKVFNRPRGLEDNVCDNGQNAYVCEMVKELKIKKCKSH